jgi:hypothetical protein
MITSVSDYEVSNDEKLMNNMVEIMPEEEVWSDI